MRAHTCSAVSWPAHPCATNGCGLEWHPEAFFSACVADSWRIICYSHFEPLIKPVLWQVFCSKQQPRCGTCPLRGMCEYALHKGPCMAAPLVGAGSQPAAAAGPAPAAEDAEAGDAMRGSGSMTGREAKETDSHAAVAERAASVDDAVPHDVALAHAAPRAVLPVLTAADREAQVLRILGAAVDTQPTGSEQTPPVEPVELDLTRHDCAFQLTRMVAVRHEILLPCAMLRTDVRLSLCKPACVSVAQEAAVILGNDGAACGPLQRMLIGRGGSSPGYRAASRCSGSRCFKHSRGVRMLLSRRARADRFSQQLQRLQTASIFVRLAAASHSAAAVSGAFHGRASRQMQPSARRQGACHA